MTQHLTPRWNWRPLLALAFVGALASMAQAQDEQVTRMRAALAAPDRPAENKARDAGRKPIESVQFFGIETGDTVVDMIAAGGWFTEVLSAAVGPSGKVYSSNPAFLVQQDAETALHKRLGNVVAVHGRSGVAAAREPRRRSHERRVRSGDPRHDGSVHVPRAQTALTRVPVNAGGSRRSTRTRAARPSGLESPDTSGERHC